MKQPFTIGGSVALKKALVEDTRIRVYDKDTCTEWDYLLCDKSFLGLQGVGVIRPIHYQLPKDWDKAVAAVKDFFAEEPTFEKDKWYYSEDSIIKRLGRYSHTDDLHGVIFSEAYTIIRDNDKACSDTNLALSKRHVKYNHQPATTEQIQEMLTKVAEQKGFVQGAKVKSVYNQEEVIKDYYKYQYQQNSDRLLLCWITIYQEGKWAELLTKEEPKPETLVLKDVGLSDVLSIGEDSTFELVKVDRVDLHLTATHLQQLKEYFNK
jgi:hypothetical protein